MTDGSQDFAAQERGIGAIKAQFDGLLEATIQNQHVAGPHVFYIAETHIHAPQYGAAREARAAQRFRPGLRGR